MFEELISALRNNADHYMAVVDGAVGMVYLLTDAADAIEELSKRVAGVTAERDAAMKRLCEWCGVGCAMENRRAELCEIAAVGLEFLADDCTSPDWATCQPEPPKEERA